MLIWFAGNRQSLKHPCHTRGICCALGSCRFVKKGLVASLHHAPPGCSYITSTSLVLPNCYIALLSLFSSLFISALRFSVNCSFLFSLLSGSVLHSQQPLPAVNQYLDTCRPVDLTPATADGRSSTKLSFPSKRTGLFPLSGS